MKARKLIILFDGDCGFCNSWVKFIISRDPKNKFKFAPIRSSIAKELILELKEHNLNLENLDSIILIENKQIYTHSTAVLRILKHLDGLNWLYIFILIPKILRDLVYKLVSRNRHRLSCSLPDENLKKQNENLKNRFLDL